ncbi:unannotated protein [freshwater metagenome]|uniref:Unannotated protein n=1 Tax=freshwater metagenome TaxID=449393 RepID=A0A6J7IWR6_9ZZZZ
MRPLLELAPVELGARERLRVLRVGHLGGVPAVLGELADPALRGRLAELGLGVAGEELPRRAGAPLLAHEEHRGERAGQRDGRADGEQARGEGGRDAVPGGPVADLVVVLQVGQEFPARQPVGVHRAAVVPLAERRPGPVVEERAGEHLGQPGQTALGEVPVVALALAGEHGVQRVVEVVAPLRGEPEPAGGPRGDHPRVVEVGLRDQGQRSALRHAERVDLGGQLLEHVGGPLVDQGVHGVQPQAVDVHVPQPHQRVVDDVPAHLVGVRPGQVDRVAPGVRPALAEHREELGQVVPRRAQVVVDDVLDHRETALVAGVDEPLVAGRPAVPLVDGVPGDAVVAPVVRAVEPVHRQQLDEADAEGHQVVQPGDGRVEGAGLGERAHVQLVDHAAGQRPPGPGPVHPAVRGGVEAAGRPVHAVGLAASSGVRSGGGGVVEQEAVVGLRRGGHGRPPPPVVVPGHLVDGAVQLQADPLGQRRPDGELGRLGAHGPSSVLHEEGDRECAEHLGQLGAAGV